MKYIVVTPIMRDGQRNEPGDEVEMPPKEAKELLDCGALAAAKPKKADKDA